MNTAKEIIKLNNKYRKQLPGLAWMEVKKQYKGSALSWVWGIIRPAILIFTFWFAITMGLRSGKPHNGYPFFLWLIAGMIPWYYMRDMISPGANCISRHAYLVTKIKFPVAVIPTFQSISYLMVNLVLTTIMIVIFALFGYAPDIYMLQLVFYYGLMFLFFTAWSLFASLMTIVSRDFLNLIRSLTQPLFWLSGILYDASTIEIGWIRTLLLFNPVTLMANGFRNSLVYHRWFWEVPGELRNFVLVYILVAVLAIVTYKKLKKVIPDIL